MDNVEKLIKEIAGKIKNNNILLIIFIALIFVGAFFVNLFSTAEGVRFIYGNF